MWLIRLALGQNLPTPSGKPEPSVNMTHPLEMVICYHLFFFKVNLACYCVWFRRECNLSNLISYTRWMIRVFSPETKNNCSGRSSGKFSILSFVGHVKVVISEWWNYATFGFLFILFIYLKWVARAYHREPIIAKDRAVSRAKDQMHKDEITDVSEPWQRI